MNKEIIIKSTLKKELIKSIVYSFIFSILQSYIFYLILDFGIKVGRRNETLKEVPFSVVFVLIPLIFIIFIMYYLGKMVMKGYFDKEGNKK